MLKILLNLILNIILGGLKGVLLKHIEAVNAESLTNSQKRQVVFDEFKKDALGAGRDITNSLINLAIETGVQLLKDKLK